MSENKKYDENSKKKDNKKKSEDNDNNKTAKRILIIIAILMIIFGSVCIGFYIYNQYNAQQNDEELSSVATTEQIDVSKAENPIDFDSLQSQNEEIYAWLYVPGTNVDYPIVQSETDDEFYLKHDALTQEWSASGAVYTELANSKDFSDSITVIYGHNGYSDTMFTTLHYFEEADFFEENEYFYIYTPTSKLTYQIISAFKYDNRHILNSFDFQNLTVLSDFQQMLLDPKSTNKNVRETLDKTVTTSDNIVILSTCITNQKSNRYLVCGVLVKNEETD